MDDWWYDTCRETEYVHLKRLGELMKKRQERREEQNLVVRVGCYQRHTHRIALFPLFFSSPFLLVLSVISSKLLRILHSFSFPFADLVPLLLLLLLLSQFGLGEKAGCIFLILRLLSFLSVCMEEEESKKAFGMARMRRQQNRDKREENRKKRNQDKKTLQEKRIRGEEIEETCSVSASSDSRSPRGGVYTAGEIPRQPSHLWDEERKRASKEKDDDRPLRKALLLGKRGESDEFSPRFIALRRTCRHASICFRRRQEREELECSLSTERPGERASSLESLSSLERVRDEKRKKTEEIKREPRKHSILRRPSLTCSPPPPPFLKGRFLDSFLSLSSAARSLLEEESRLPAFHEAPREPSMQGVRRERSDLQTTRNERSAQSPASSLEKPRRKR